MRQVSNVMLLFHDNLISQKFYLWNLELMIQLKLCLKPIHLIIPVH